MPGLRSAQGTSPLVLSRSGLGFGPKGHFRGFVFSDWLLGCFHIVKKINDDDCYEIFYHQNRGSGDKNCLKVRN